MAKIRRKAVRCKNFPNCLKIISGKLGGRKKSKTGYCRSCNAKIYAKRNVRGIYKKHENKKPTL